MLTAVQTQHGSAYQGYLRGFHEQIDADTDTISNICNKFKMIHWIEASDQSYLYIIIVNSFLFLRVNLHNSAYDHDLQKETM